MLVVDLDIAELFAKVAVKGYQVELAPLKFLERQHGISTMFESTVGTVTYLKSASVSLCSDSYVEILMRQSMLLLIPESNATRLVFSLCSAPNTTLAVLTR